MRRPPVAWLMAAVLLLSGWLWAATDTPGRALVAHVDGAIGPATEAFVADAIAKAEDQGARVLILRIDTPGGLDSAMRSIIKSIHASSVPVVGYVAPSGARAASAGTYILYATHVAAMAPGTTLGAATPVQMGGMPGGGERDRGRSPAADGDEADDNGDAEPAPVDGDAMTKKLVNDAVAYIRGLAKMHGRNADWAEKAVREGASLPAEEAVAIGVVDLVVRDIDQLLQAIDGRTVQLQGEDHVLDTADLVLTELEPDWRLKLLAIISNPNVAYILMLIGIYGLIYEFSNPGAIFPGTVGAVSLVLALYSFQLLPVNYAGLALILLGLALMVAEAFAPSFGALGVGGVAAFIVGSLILIDTDVPGFGLSIPLVLAFAATSALLLFFIVTMAVRSYRKPIVSGAEELVGARGLATHAFTEDGTVHLHGEDWAARSSRPIDAGQSVRVTGRDGLVLLVEPDIQLDKEP
ncbi:nodulation protein NfeD [Thioalkalicoccus limnaeus]|uniref:Nodulation protein NfeD n=1 Tax=Thioalkalicoccus limnaeus TaxID=120681 RepID=A0ABV4BCF7_9GAMM